MKETIKMDRIEDAIADFKEGKFVIVVDDEDRENEGDLIIAAEKITPEKRKRRSHTSRRERYKKAIYPTNEKADLFTGETAHQVSEPRMQPKFFRNSESLFRPFQSRILPNVCQHIRSQPKKRL